MTLRIFDGFENGDHFTKWATSSVDQYYALNANTRFGYGKCLSIYGSGRYLEHAIPGGVSGGVYLGTAVSFNAYQSGNIMAFYNHLVLSPIFVRWYTTAMLGVYSNNVLLGSAAVNFPYTSWLYLEAFCKIADSGGQVIVKVDGTEVINYTGDTSYNSNGDDVASVRLYAAGQYVYYDDVYICDAVDATATQGAPYNDFLGPCRVYSPPIDGAGTDTDMTPSSGSNYQCVDEQPFSATDYVTGTTGQRDTYSVSSIPSDAGTIYATQVTALAKKTDASAYSAKTALRSGTTLDTGVSTALGDSDSTLRTLYTEDPDTSTAWTISGVNAVEVGVEVT